MQNSFLQKFVLCIILGAAAAGVIKFYKVFIADADEMLQPTKKAQHEAGAR